MVRCTAPGKVYLFGEHAVVYGEPAIACAIDLRTSVTATRSGSIKISSDIGTTGLDFEKHPYVSAAIRKLGEGSPLNVSINIESDIPVGAGLGSSAAVSIATLSAINLEFGLGYDRYELADMGHEIEKEVQGAASPTDTFVSTLGGIIQIPARKRLESLECSVVIGNTNKGVTPGKTARLVKHVADFKEKYPEVVDPIIKTIGKFAGKGETLVPEKDYGSLGELMNMNHGLLDALGVGTGGLSSLVYAARDSGAFGAKITGAGGGGCMFALTDKPEEVAAAIEAAGGQAIITRFTEEGVMRR